MNDCHSGAARGRAGQSATLSGESEITEVSGLIFDPTFWMSSAPGAGLRGGAVGDPAGGDGLPVRAPPPFHRPRPQLRRLRKTLLRQVNWAALT